MRVSEKGGANKGQTPKNIHGTPGKKLTAGHKVGKWQGGSKKSEKPY